MGPLLAFINPHLHNILLICHLRQVMTDWNLLKTQNLYLRVYSDETTNMKFTYEYILLYLVYTFLSIWKSCVLLYYLFHAAKFYMKREVWAGMTLVVNTTDMNSLCGVSVALKKMVSWFKTKSTILGMSWRWLLWHLA